jgi:3-oxoacyl-[acyl-carrier protein] reductase
VVDYLHDQRAVESTVESILAGDGDAMAISADVTDGQDVQRLFDEIIKVFGGVNAVVHTAGSHLTATSTRPPRPSRTCSRKRSR